MARQIVGDFSNAGFDINQQVAANAIDESGLDPTQHNGRGEDSFGLFQLNRKGGLGAGHSPEELLDPENNIQIALRAAKNSKAFSRATSLVDAVSAFVKDVERPKDPTKDTADRIVIANRLIS